MMPFVIVVTLLIKLEGGIFDRNFSRAFPKQDHSIYLGEILGRILSKKRGEERREGGDHVGEPTGYVKALIF